jgi:hypothetical protein
MQKQQQQHQRGDNNKMMIPRPKRLLIGSIEVSLSSLSSNSESSGHAGTPTLTFSSFSTAGIRQFYLESNQNQRCNALDSFF